MLTIKPEVVEQVATEQMFQALRRAAARPQKHHIPFLLELIPLLLGRAAQAAVAQTALMVLILFLEPLHLQAAVGEAATATQKTARREALAAVRVTPIPSWVKLIQGVLEQQIKGMRGEMRPDILLLILAAAGAEPGLLAMMAEVQPQMAVLEFHRQ